MKLTPAQIEALAAEEVARNADDLGGYALPCDGGTYSQMARAVSMTDKGDSEFIASTDKEARDGDIIDQASWKLGHYRKNPVILDNHNTGIVVGRAADIRVFEGSLRVAVKWDDSEANPIGRLVAHQHREGFRKAVSVRWIPGTITARNTLEPDSPYFSKGKKVQTPWGTEELRVGSVHTSNTLLEVSSVSIPSDPRALQVRGFGAADVARVMGFEVQDEGAARALDEAIADLVPRDELRALMLTFLRSEEARLAIRAMGLLEPVPVPKPAPTLRGDGLDHLY